MYFCTVNLQSRNNNRGTRNHIFFVKWLEHFLGWNQRDDKKKQDKRRQEQDKRKQEQDKKKTRREGGREQREPPLPNPNGRGETLFYDFVKSTDCFAVARLGVVLLVLI